MVPAWTAHCIPQHETCFLLEWCGSGSMLPCFAGDSTFTAGRTCRCEQLPDNDKRHGYQVHVDNKYGTLFSCTQQCTSACQVQGLSRQSLSIWRRVAHYPYSAHACALHNGERPCNETTPGSWGPDIFAHRQRHVRCKPVICTCAPPILHGRSVCTS